MADETAIREQKRNNLEGKYLTFALATEHYGVEILKVLEIMGMIHITRVPRCPSFMKGVINLRGKIIPVIDLRMKFGMPPAEYNERTCTVIVNVSLGDTTHPLGMVVDTVHEVVEFKSSNIEPPPDFGSSVDTNFILGIGKRQNDSQVVILVDINKVLSEWSGETLLSFSSP